MKKGTHYVARQANAEGFIDYPQQEHDIWQALVSRQMKLLDGRACDEYLAGLQRLELPLDRIPQLGEISAVLNDFTGWSVQQVPALIDFGEFFNLLANKRFPVATFIRSEKDFDYLQEPDIFHEIFGHCPLLTHPAFAEFTHRYGQLGQNATPAERGYLARLYWFTVEFGLLQPRADGSGRRIYGGGILSSPGETLYALDSQDVQRRPFDLMDVLRTPYRIDIMQTVYYELDSVDALFELSKMDILDFVHKAQALPLFEPTFPPKQKAS